MKFPVQSWMNVREYYSRALEQVTLVQVAKSGSVRLLLGADRLVQNLDLGLTVKRASLASPHLLVMSDRGDLVLVTLEEGPSKKGAHQG